MMKIAVFETLLQNNKDVKVYQWNLQILMTENC